ncbi:MAG: YIP1 family protein [Treponema sp.]|uniref:hypothetical protein n=1 Tax=Treponema sp. TaxID=166 RepID=UPI0025D582E2|nr:hypothetical protein [Treponema sp.]MBQ7538604.1 YIP1 family protein [Treponema sp.]MBR0496921.1 YIP1 family protein [Treponema sp.]
MEKNNDSFLNAQKGSGVARNESFHKQEELQEEIFSLILTSPDNFDINEWIENFKSFSKNYKKLLYSKISSRIISCEDGKKIENLTNNISTVIEAIKTRDEDKNAEGAFIFVDKDCYTLFLKFYDHCNLAMVQRAVYLKTEQEFNKISSETKEAVNKSLEKATGEINNHVEESEQKITSLEKNITGQLISLITIFTSLSFVIFGGISSLSSMMSYVKKASVQRILFIGIIWMICMTNIFMLFIKLISKFSKEDVSLKGYFIYVNLCLMVLLIALLIKFLVLN